MIVVLFHKQDVGVQLFIFLSEVLQLQIVLLHQRVGLVLTASIVGRIVQLSRACLHLVNLLNVLSQPLLMILQLTQQGSIAVELIAIDEFFVHRLTKCPKLKDRNALL